MPLPSRRFPNAAIRVVVADDHPAVRAGLRALFATDRRIELVGEASDGSNAFDLVGRLDPDVLIMDNQMPGASGLDVARRLRARGGASPAIVVLNFDPASSRGEPIADCYLERGVSGSEIIRAIHEVADAAGRVYT